MKRKIKMLLIAFVFILGLSSCTNGTIVKISEEVEYTQIQNDISKVYSTVSAGCVGIAVSNSASSVSASGSGVIYAYDEATELYYVVTNAHVVEDMTKFNIFFGAGVYNSADLVGYDSKNDIAVLTFKLDLLNKDLKNKIYVNDFFNYADNDLVSIGQTVLAIGCPLGLSNFNILTTGIVSSVDSYQVSTDCALNPGNSGGGLFNLEGRLIGINTEKEVWTSSTDDNGNPETIPVEGRSYAMSLDVVKKCINDILKYNDVVERPRFGMTVVTINILYGDHTQYQDYFVEREGIYEYFVVTDFELASAAKSCGVKHNDQLLKINGTEIRSISDISNVLNFAVMTDTITLQIYRKGTGIVDIAVKFNSTEILK